MVDGDELWQRKKRRAFFISQLYQWHWISSGLCLVGMILFAFTGITLNNAGKIEAKPSVVMRESQLPQALLAELKTAPHIAKAALPSNVSAWLYQEIGVNTADRETEWSAREIYIALPRPGGDAWLSIERDSGAISYELTNRGWIAYLNDLHKGRNAGKAWSWFIDLFATAAIIFCLTGLLLLQLHAKRRPATWPVVSLGLIIPTLLAVLLIHR
ncbi:PepSY-associated TM helix domain-containing protein [[Pseudomonas] carboxydohydrogena]|uniref:PepSY-associated TM helix domain-containing protein n=1 Tax=Afipia carboxydohydrogena TaxID=290 RepID=A0ABY8BNP0_AFICR|nr:PepSY-associated TM helix domain-containing protein [[Pseudomonas] carboxydohydrogena]WEF51304.1 PepSY-associated TM helix domain-containing protein [[Pseudomonas] carboxydohydrogena]